MMQYTVVARGMTPHQTPDDFFFTFQQIVNQYIATGWTPLGGISIKDLGAAQAMTREEPKYR